MKPVSKSQKQLAAEWDALAERRHEQISSGKDLSFAHVVVPTILSLCRLNSQNEVVDIGCGTGFLTREISGFVKSVVAVDSSSQSIAIAKRHCSGISNVSFIDSDFSSYVRTTQKKFDLAVANMTLMTVLDLDDVLASIAKILSAGAQFNFTIIHPCFWPKYKNYLLEDWFSYWDDMQIEAPFTISLDLDVSTITTHVHRPLEHYIASLVNAGFTITKIIEPRPEPEIASQYPTVWKYPRFMSCSCIYTGHHVAPVD